jgi:hypothetical protein
MVAIRCVIAILGLTVTILRELVISCIVFLLNDRTKFLMERNYVCVLFHLSYHEFVIALLCIMNNISVVNNK